MINLDKSGIIITFIVLSLFIIVVGGVLYLIANGQSEVHDRKILCEQQNMIYSGGNYENAKCVPIASCIDQPWKCQRGTK